VGNGGQAVNFAIYYRPSDGEIMGWTTSFDPVAPDGMNLAVFDDVWQPNPMIERFDAVANAVMEKTTEEKRLSRLPTMAEVRSAVFVELQRTDPLMLDDYPHHGNDRREWIDYRRMLRELSGDVADMINDWTLPPDGIDPITALRERL
jgi:hypothetical protein